LRKQSIFWIIALLTAFATHTPAIASEDSATSDETLVTTITRSLDPVPLQSLIGEVMLRNPEIAAAERRAAAFEARTPQVHSLPDPMASLTPFLQSPETRVGPQELTVAISQKFPWFGKLDLREQVAMLAAVAARADVDTKRLALLEETSRLYYELAFLDRQAEIVRNDRATLAHYEELARTRYAAGIGTSQAPIKIQAEITKDENRLLEIAKRRAQGLASINALRDFPDAVDVKTPVLPRLAAVTVRPEQWLERALAARPELVSARADVDRASTGVELAKKDYMPDVTVGLGYTLVGNRSDPAGIAVPPPDNGQDVIALTAGINLPIWRKRLAAGVDEASEKHEAAEAAERARIASIRRQLDDLAQRLPLTEDQIHLFEDVLIRQAEQSLISAEGGYAAGTLGALDLLDAQRVLLEARTAAARARADYAIAAARLAAATASPLDLPIANELKEGTEQ